MPLYLVEKDIRPDVLPSPRLTEHLFTENTLGDLHGNAIKLIHALVEMGFIKDFSAEQYATLIAIYHQAFHRIDTITSADLNTFKTIIEHLHVHNTTMALRLLGDELCDRGSCDWFTLIILAKLATAGINFEILISNHSFDFMIALEGDLPFNQIIKLCVPDQRHSANQVQSLIDNKLIAREEISSLYKQCYLTRLKLISYSKMDEFIAIYTHAPVGMASINCLLQDICKDKLNEETDFFKKIDLCNQIFQAEYVQNFKIHTLDNVDSFIQLIWNRNSEFYQDRPKEFLTKHGLIPAYFIHGHDQTQSSSISLDNEFAKKPFIRPTHHAEKYTLLGCSVTPLLDYPEEIKEISCLAIHRLLDLDFEPFDVDVRPALYQYPDLSSIKTLTDFINTTGSLNEDSIPTFFAAMEQQNPELLRRADEHNHATSPSFKNPWLPHSLFAQQKKEGLMPQELMSIDQFKMILRELRASAINVSQTNRFVHDSLPNILPLIQSAASFDTAISELDLKHKSDLFRLMRAQLPEMINTVIDYYWISRSLEFDERALLFEDITLKLPDLIKNASDFRLIIKCVDLIHINSMFFVMSGKLPDLINTYQEFNLTLLALQDKQVVIPGVLEAIKEQLPNIINSSEEFDCTWSLLLNYDAAASLFLNQLLMHVLMLEAKGISFSAKYAQGTNLFMSAAQYGQVGMLSHLRQKQTLIDESNDEGNTALSLAASFGELNAMQWLCSQGAALDKANKNGHTPLMLAAKNGQFTAVRWLLIKGAAPGDKDKFGHSALLLASCYGHVAIIKELLQYGASVLECNKYGDNALLLAAANKQGETLSYLLSNEDYLTQTNHGRCSLLFYLAQDEQLFLEIVPKLAQLIASRFIFSEVLFQLKPSQVELLVRLMDERLSLFISSADELVGLISFLDASKITILIRTLNNRLFSVFYTVEELATILSVLNRSQSESFVVAMQNQLSELITTADDLKIISSYIGPAHKDLFIELIQAEELHLLFEDDEFDDFLNSFEMWQRTIIIDSLQDYSAFHLNNN